MASFWKFLSWIEKELSFAKSCWNVESESLYTNLSALSCSLFIIVLSVLLWNIQTNGQFPNWDSIKAFMITLTYAYSYNPKFLPVSESLG